MNILIFCLIYFFVIFFIRGFLIFLNISFFKKNIKVDELKVFNIDLLYFYPILFLFFIGNITLLLNFFIAQKELKIIQLMFTFFILVFNFIEKVQLNEKNKLFLIVLIPLILSISTYGQRLHLDTIDYHLISQKWIIENKISFGLTNIYNALGWATLFEYIQANFWINNNYSYLHYVNVLFFVNFFHFVIASAIQNENKIMKFSSINLIFFSFLDNFGLGGGGNTFLKFQSIGKADLAAGILFIISNILLLQAIKKIKDKSSNISIFDFHLICILVIFSFQVKITNIVTIFLFLYFIFYLNKLKKIKLFVNLIAYFFISIIFFFKNFIISGCIIFPVSFSCFSNLSWSNKDDIVSWGNQVRYYNFALNIERIKNIDKWYFDWINNAYNKQIYFNYLVSIIIVFIIRYIFTQKDKERKKSYKLIYLNSFYIVAFFLFGPTERYGFGILSLLVSTVAFSRISLKESIDLNFLKKFLISLSILCVILTPRIYSYKTFLEYKFENYIVDVPNSLYKPTFGWGYLTLSKGDHCILKLNCFREYKNLNLIVKNSYLFFSK